MHLSFATFRWVCVALTKPRQHEPFAEASREGTNQNSSWELGFRGNLCNLMQDKYIVLLYPKCQSRQSSSTSKHCTIAYSWKLVAALQAEFSVCKAFREAFIRSTIGSFYRPWYALKLFLTHYFQPSRHHVLAASIYRNIWSKQHVVESVVRLFWPTFYLLSTGSPLILALVFLN